GHRHPRVIAAVKDQLDHFTHTCHQVVPYESYVHLAERLNVLVPGYFEKKTIFVTTAERPVAARAILTAFSTASAPV
ncbi:aminotransferase class III-fold pyridoxal phosphate-dependent enzyme, partial [Rhizobium ruizarguesonis]